MTVILASFEACLSVIVVCIPLLHPVGSAISTTLRSLLSRRSSHSDRQRSSTEAPFQQNKKILPFAGSDRPKFKRLQDHLFPISQEEASKQLLYGGNTTTDIQGETGSELGSELQDLNSSASISVTHGIRNTFGHQV